MEAKYKKLRASCVKLWRGLWSHVSAPGLYLSLVDLDSHVKETLGRQAWQLMTLIATNNQGRSG